MLITWFIKSLISYNIHSGKKHSELLISDIGYSADALYIDSTALDNLDCYSNIFNIHIIIDIDG